MSRLNDLLRLRDFIDAEIRSERERHEPTTVDIIDAAARLYEVDEAFLANNDRNNRDVIKARHAVCWLLRQRGMSTPAIGRIVSRDHTTVMHACRTVDADPGRVAILRQLLDDHPADTPEARLRQLVRAAS